MTKLCTTNWFYIFATSESHNFSKWHRYSRNSLPHEPVRPSRDHSFFKNLKFPCGMFPLYTVLFKVRLGMNGFRFEYLYTRQANPRCSFPRMSHDA